MSKNGRAFEEAVARFVATLDATAEVLFDHKVPDCHTGTPRQADVWINAKFGGHFPYSVLVSCKDHGRRLDISDIDAFRGEIAALGASMGVIYSGAGFTKPALEKARVLGIACCRLFRNQPSDIPEAILLRYYFCISRLHLSITGDERILDGIRTWDSLFALPSGDAGQTVLDALQAVYAEQINPHLLEERTPEQFPKVWESTVTFVGGTGAHIAIKIGVSWRRFRAPADAPSLDGSYSYPNSTFRGSQYGPVIDTWHPPGEGWIEMSTTEAMPQGSRAVIIFGPPPDIRPDLREHFKNKELRNVGPTGDAK